MAKGVKLKELIKENILFQVSGVYPEIPEILESIKNVKVALKEKDINFLLQETHQLIVQFFKNIPELSRLFFRIGLRCEDEGLIEEAIFYYRLSNLLKPNAKAINNLAVLYAEVGREKEAIKILKEGIKNFPENSILKENLQILQSER